MNVLKKHGTPLLVLFVLGLFGLYALGSALSTDVPPKKYNGFDLASLRVVPVVDGGRLKPLDTLTRTTLRLNNGSEVYEDEEENKYPAIIWFLESISNDSDADTGTGPFWNTKAFKIDNDQIRNVLSLPTRSGLRYTLNEFGSKFKVLQVEHDKALETPREKRDLYQEKLLEFYDRLTEFTRVSQLFVRAVPPKSPGADWESLGERRKRCMDEAEDIAQQKTIAKFDLNNTDFKVLAVEKRDEILRWRNQARKQEYERLQEQDPELKPWLDLSKAYRAKDSETFNQTVSQLAGHADELSPKEQRSLKLEVFLNRFAPLYKCTVMYFAAAVLALVGLLLTGWSRQLSPPFRWASFALICMTFSIHVFGLVARMYIQGRPPVTNLYSSAVFIGCGAVLLCGILEIIRPLGIANVVGASLGFMTTLIAHGLGNGNDTMEMMQAVLDTNFWLATHVTMVTLGYVATYVAGFLGILFILLGICTPVLDRHAFKSLSGMIYGTVCFATFLSFVGTVLGGIWADYSWGRFWGWDPKENGALLIVMWNAVVLHARWGGLVKQRGVAVLAVFGNIVTTLSWFGTNMLGVGLHNYGFSNLGFWIMVGSFVAMTCMIVLGSAVPLRSWTSNGEQFARAPSVI
jgi:ABC-type transport system involved in cytochrome c biogenesis permease subunit